MAITAILIITASSRMLLRNLLNARHLPDLTHLLDSHRSSLVFQGCDFSRSRSQTVAVQGLDLGRLAQSLCP